MSQNDGNYFDQFQFIKIYDQYSDKIFRHIYFQVRDREKALDLMQETFMKTFVHMKKNGPVGNIKAFLYKVATNTTIDNFKKKKTYSLEKLEEDGYTPSIDSAVETKTKFDAEKILEIIGQIPQRYQAVMVMRYVDELSVKEIAEVLGESQNAISVKIHRGISQIRKILNL